MSSRSMANNRRVLIDKLPQNTTSDEIIQELFKSQNFKYSNVDFEGSSAIVTLSNGSEAQRAAKLINGQLFKGVRISVTEAPAKQSSTPAKQFSTPGSAIVVVGNLSFDYTEDQLRDLMSPHGEIKKSFLVYGKISKKSKGYGFVEYKNKQSATRAKEHFMKRSAKLLDGRLVRVEIVTPNLSVGEAKHSQTLFLDKLPKSFDDEDELANLFNSVGKVTYCQVARAKDGQPRGFALVDFATVIDAEKAQGKLDGKPVGDSKIRISFCTPGRTAQDNVSKFDEQSNRQPGGGFGPGGFRSAMPGLHGPRIPKLLDSNHGPLMPMDGFGRPGFPQGPPAPMPLGIGGMPHISHMPLPHISGDLMHPPLLGQPVPPGIHPGPPLRVPGGLSGPNTRAPHIHTLNIRTIRPNTQAGQGFNKVRPNNKTVVKTHRPRTTPVKKITSKASEPGSKTKAELKKMPSKKDGNKEAKDVNRSSEGESSTNEKPAKSKQPKPDEKVSTPDPLAALQKIGESAVAAAMSQSSAEGGQVKVLQPVVFMDTEQLKQFQQFQELMNKQKEAEKSGDSLAVSLEDLVEAARGLKQAKEEKTENLEASDKPDSGVVQESNQSHVSQTNVPAEKNEQSKDSTQQPSVSKPTVSKPSPALKTPSPAAIKLSRAITSSSSTPSEHSPVVSTPTPVTSKPAKASTAPVKASTAPVKSSAAPVKALTAPVKASAAPVKASAAPVKSTQRSQPLRQLKQEQPLRQLKQEQPLRQLKQEIPKPKVVPTTSSQNAPRRSSQPQQQPQAAGEPRPIKAVGTYEREKKSYDRNDYNDSKPSANSLSRSDSPSSSPMPGTPKTTLGASLLQKILSRTGVDKPDYGNDQRTASGQADSRYNYGGPYQSGGKSNSPVGEMSRGLPNANKQPQYGYNKQYQNTDGRDYASNRSAANERDSPTQNNSRSRYTLQERFPQARSGNAESSYPPAAQRYERNTEREPVSYPRPRSEFSSRQDKQPAREMPPYGSPQSRGTFEPRDPVPSRDMRSIHDAVVSRNISSLRELLPSRDDSSHSRDTLPPRDRSSHEYISRDASYNLPPRDGPPRDVPRSRDNVPPRDMLPARGIPPRLDRSARDSSFMREMDGPRGREPGPYHQVSPSRYQSSPGSSREALDRARFERSLTAAHDSRNDYPGYGMKSDNRFGRDLPTRESAMGTIRGPPPRYLMEGPLNKRPRY